MINGFGYCSSNLTLSQLHNWQLEFQNQIEIFMVVIICVKVFITYIATDSILIKKAQNTVYGKHNLAPRIEL